MVTDGDMPRMEEQCVLFKAFGVDADVIKSTDVDTIMETIRLISGSFGGSTWNIASPAVLK